MSETDKISRIREKKKELEQYFRGLGRVAIAFSSGVDSTFLLKVAHDTLGEHAVAVTARACTFPEHEWKEAAAFCEREGIRQIIWYFEPFQVQGFEDNPPERCYLCKRALFEQLKRKACEQGFDIVAEGSNMDDTGDYRPGLRAIQELHIKSPLQEVGLYKEEIRELSKELGLATWEKPSYACLASRFVYGERITKEKLVMVEQAENWLFANGFRQARVRVHGLMARIEVLPEAFERLIQKERREELVSAFRAFGFTYVSMDLAGYRSGSMNETIGMSN